MPKTKKLEDSDSDSGPEDRNPPPAKKDKKDDQHDQASGTQKKDDEGNLYWELDRNRRVSLSSFKGKQYLNIREYYQDKGSGKMRPGKSGITLTKMEWQQLLALTEQIKFDN